MQKCSGRSAPFARIWACVGFPSSAPQVDCGIGDHGGAVVVHDRVDVGHRGKDPLVAAGEPGHEVGLDESQHDPLVGLDVGPVHEDGATVRGPSGERERRGVPGRVIDDAVRGRHGPPDHALELRGRVPSVGARAVDDRDVAGGNVRQLLEEPRQEAFGGQGPRDVGNHHGDPVARADQVPERPGVDRGAHGLAERGGLVRQTRHEPGLDHRDVGGVRHQIEPIRPVLEANARHCSP